MEWVGLQGGQFQSLAQVALKPPREHFPNFSLSYYHRSQAGRPAIPRPCAINPRDGTLATLSYSHNNDQLQLWEPSSGRLKSARLLSLAPGLEGWALATDVNQLSWLDLNTGQARALAPDLPSPGQIQFIQPIASDQAIIIRHLEGRAQIEFSYQIEHWDLARGELIATAVLTGEALVVSASGEAAAARLGDQLVILDIRQGQVVQTLALSRWVTNYSWQFTPDGAELAVVKDTWVQFWNWRTGEELRRLAGRELPIGQLVFSADGRRLAATTGEIWDLEGGWLSALFANPADRLALSPDGSLIVGSDGKVWDSRTGEVAAELETAAEPLGFGFTRDGRRLVWLAPDGVVSVWGVDPR